MTQHGSRRVIGTLAVNLDEEAVDRDAFLEIAKHIWQKEDANRVQALMQILYIVGVFQQLLQVLDVTNSPTTLRWGLKANRESSMETLDISDRNLSMSTVKLRRTVSFPTNKHGTNCAICYMAMPKDYNWILFTAMSPRSNRQFIWLRQSITPLLFITRIENYLNTLRMNHFASEALEATGALENVYRAVTKLARQVPRAFFGQDHRVLFLRKAVVGNERSSQELNGSVTWL